MGGQNIRRNPYFNQLGRAAGSEAGQGGSPKGAKPMPADMGGAKRPYSQTEQRRLELKKLDDMLIRNSMQASKRSLSGKRGMGTPSSRTQPGRGPGPSRPYAGGSPKGAPVSGEEGLYSRRPRPIRNGFRR